MVSFIPTAVFSTSMEETAKAGFVLESKNVNQDIGEIAVNLILKDAPQGVAGFQLTIDYASYADYISYTTTTGITGYTQVSETDHKITLTGASSTNLKENAILATFKFKINKEKYLEEDIPAILKLEATEEQITYRPESESEPTKTIDDVHVTTTSGTITISPMVSMLGDVNEDNKLTTADVVDILMEITRDVKIFTEKQKSAGNVVIENGEPIVSVPTAVDARKILNAIHESKPIAEREDRK